MSTVDWSTVFNNGINDLYDAFCNTLFSIIDEFVPKASYKSTPIRRRYYPKSIRALQNRKLIIWRKWQANKKNLNLKQKYVSISKQCRMALHEHHVNKEKSLIESGNLGRFYKYVNRKLSTKTGIGVLKSDAGELIKDPADQAEMLNAFFATTFVTDNGTLPDFPARVPPDMSLSYIAFPANDVARKLNKLRVDSASGPDGLPTCFSRRCLNSLVSL